MDSPLKLPFYWNLITENSFPLSFALNAKDNSEEGEMVAAFKTRSI